MTLKRLVWGCSLAVAAAACSGGDPSAQPIVQGTVAGAINAEFDCRVAVTYHAADNTTYVALNLVDRSLDGAWALRPGLVWIEGRVELGTYSSTDGRVKLFASGVVSKAGTGLAVARARGVAGAEECGDGSITFSQLTPIPGAELPEDQAFSARGEFHAILSEKGAARSVRSAKMVVKF